MIRAGLKFVTAALALSLLATGCEAATKVQRVVSPGGITAWFVRDQTVPLIAMEYAFAGGTSQDPQDKPGVAHMTAQLLDEGAGELDSRNFREHLEQRAIQLTFNATRDQIRGSLRTLTENRGEAFELLQLALTAPRFDAEPLERIRADMMSNLRRETTNPGALANKKFWEASFTGHPYGRSMTGTLESVPTLAAADLRTYANKVFARDTLLIAVVGDIEEADLGVLIDKTFGSLPAKSDLVPVAATAPHPDARRYFVALDVPQTVVMFGGPGIARSDPGFMAAYVVNHILGGGSFSSRLYREIREKRGLAYSVSESLYWLKSASLVIGNTATRADRANETVDTIAREVERMAAEGPTQQELNEAKSYLKGSQMLALDTSAKLAGAMLQYQSDGLDIDYIEKRNAIVDAVTLDDAKAAARRLWTNGLTTVIVGREQSAAKQPSAN